MFSHSVSIAIDNSLTKEPVFIENRDPEALIKEFVEELTHRREIILREVWDKYLMIDESSLPKQVQERWMNWINQVPVLGFNGGKFDLNLVKEHFIKTLSNTNDVAVAMKDNSYMFLMTPSFNFLDVKNYLAPRLSYDGWCTANECAVSKLVFHTNGWTIMISYLMSSLQSTRTFTLSLRVALRLL